jgi:structural maintenance of chromosome 2
VLIGLLTDRKRFFGKAGTPYDFQGVNLNQAREQCRELEAQHKGMGRKINTKVMNMIDRSARHSSLWKPALADVYSVEKKEQALKKMMSTVLKDKSKIEDTIAELDRYKRDALMQTWEKVNGWVTSVLRWAVGAG